VSTVLFRCPGKRGLGHVVRAANVAHALRELDLAVRPVIYTRGAAAANIAGPTIECVVERDPETLAGWSALVAVEQPAAVVDDTMLPDDALPPGGERARRVYVMRRSREGRHETVVESAAVRACDLILIPHDRAEFGYDLPAEVSERAVFTGPIIRRPQEADVAAIRRRYGAEGAFLLVSTVGGGGFADTAANLFAIAFEAEAALRSRLATLRHVVVRGPNYRGQLPEGEGRTVVEFEPAMTALLATADLVVAEGGYNTVNEIRLVAAPTAFVPGRRHWDDQELRVAELAGQGLGVVAEAAADVVALALATERRAAQRKALAAARPEPGNRRAAEAILRCIQTPR